ncbi:DUF1127 domain-containing protein [Pseudomonas reactans]|nr:DUF1127 domain-containing protein [Pseudomonas reactans]
MKKMMKERQYCDHICGGSAGSLSTTKQPAAVMKPQKQSWLSRLKMALRQQKAGKVKNLSHPTIESLSDSQLRDIGLSRDELNKEQNRTGWPDLPRGIK